MARPIDPALQGKILEAARTVLAEHGYTGTRMADVAAQAGIATGTIYLYFKSKDALVLALTEALNLRLLEAVSPKLAQPDFATAIADAARAALAVCASERDLLKLLYLNVGLSKLVEMTLPTYDLLHQQLAATLAKQMQAGIVYAYDPKTLAELLIGLIDWTAQACLIWGDGDLPMYEATLIQMLQRALVVGMGDKEIGIQIANTDN